MTTMVIFRDPLLKSIEAICVSREGGARPGTNAMATPEFKHKQSQLNRRLGLR